MILHDKTNKEDREQGPLSAICGIRIESVELGGNDVDELLKLSPENLRMWLVSVSHRFRRFELDPKIWHSRPEYPLADMTESEFKRLYECNPVPTGFDPAEPGEDKTVTGTFKSGSSSFD